MSPDTEPAAAPPKRVSLERHPEWPEIELRLRYGTTVERVMAWFAARYPTQPPLSRLALARFVSKKPREWFRGKQLVAEAVGTQRLLVLEEQVELIEMTKQRMMNALKTESALSGFMMPELREMTALLAKLLMDHHRVQQEMGLEPKRTGWEVPTEGDTDADPGTTMLIERIVRAPTAEFMQTMTALGFGPKGPKWVGNGDPPPRATGPIVDLPPNGGPEHERDANGDGR